MLVKTKAPIKKEKKTISKITVKTDEAPNYVGVLLDEHTGIYSWRKTPITQSWLDDFIKRYIDWGRKEDSFRYILFLDKEDIHENTFLRWRQKFPKLEAAHQHVNELIGARMDIGAMKRALDGNHVSKTLGHYSQVFKSEQERVSKMNNEKAQGFTGDIIVNVKPTPDTGRVKKMIKKEKDDNKN